MATFQNSSASLSWGTQFNYQETGIQCHFANIHGNCLGVKIVSIEELSIKLGEIKMHACDPVGRNAHCFCSFCK